MRGGYMDYHHRTPVASKSNLFILVLGGRRNLSHCPQNILSSFSAHGLLSSTALGHEKAGGDQEGTWSGLAAVVSGGSEKENNFPENCKESAVTYPLHLGTIWEPFGNHLTLMVFFMSKKVTLTLNPLNCMIRAACHWEVIETQIISISGAGAAGEPDKLPQDGGSLVAMEHLYLVRAAEQTSAGQGNQGMISAAEITLPQALCEHNASGRRCNGRRIQVVLQLLTKSKWNV